MSEGVKGMEAPVDPLEKITHQATKMAVKEMREALANVHGARFSSDEALLQLKQIEQTISSIHFWKVNPEAETAVSRLKSIALREIGNLINSL